MEDELKSLRVKSQKFKLKLSGRNQQKIAYTLNEGTNASLTLLGDAIKYKNLNI